MKPFMASLYGAGWLAAVVCTCISEFGSFWFFWGFGFAVANAFFFLQEVSS